MVSENLESVTEIMRFMIGAERAVSAFYHACSERFCQNAAFWKELEYDETVHAEMLSLMLRRVHEKPEEFQVGNASSVAVVSSLVEHLEDDRQKVQSGQMDEDTAIFKSFHIESMFVEQKYAEVIATENEKYVGVLNQLRDETGGHKERIAKRMKCHKSYDPQACCSDKHDPK